MASLTEALKKKVQQIPKYISIKELPNKVELKLVAFAFRNDNRGKESLFLTLQTREGAYVVQKYGRSTFEALLDAIEAAGGEDYLRNNFHPWVMEKRGKAIYPRLYPVPKG
jgi:crotonobetainyl-CoA:carnitine CoA-transferase CaiB-like acyl-CoA transferase